MAKTLDLLKAVLQPSFNMEVKRLCDDYKYIYAMAASNIRENTGDMVPQSTLKLLIMKMIEEVVYVCVCVCVSEKLVLYESNEVKQMSVVLKC